MNKDWTGNKNSVYKTLGASSHTKEDREENDYYATNPEAVHILLENESFTRVLEPACGEGHISKVLEDYLLEVESYDLIDRGFGKQKDFFDIEHFEGDIITNPPYSIARQFLEHSMAIIPEGSKVAMFLKLQFLEGKARKKMFENFPPKTVYVFSSRMACAKGGDFSKLEGQGSVAYCWYVWVKGFQGSPIIKWVN